MYTHAIFRPVEAERKRQRFSAKEFAEACGYDRSYITQYERGHREVSARFKSVASRVLDVPVDQLFPEKPS